MGLKLTADADDLDHLLNTGALQPHLAIPQPMAAPELGAPSMSTPLDLSSAVPILKAPTKQESQEAGKREFEAGMPQVTAEAQAHPFSKEYYDQKQAQLDYKQAHPWGSPISEHPGLAGKVGHALADVGNIVGAFAPGVTAEIPGSRLNNELQTAQNEAGEQKAQQEETAKEAVEQKPDIVESQNQTKRDVAQAKADATEPPEQKKQDTISSELAKMGYSVQFDKDGNVSGVKAIPGFTPAAGARPDAYHEWLGSHPNGTYDDFLKDTQQAKGQGRPSGMSIYGLARMMQMAYDTDPRLVPLIPGLINQAGIETPKGFDLSGPAAGQPRDSQGNPIGLRMPESPTGTTRGRGQFAQAVTDSIPNIKKEISNLGSQLGPIQGRISEFMAGKIGADKPEFYGLKTDLDNTATAWMRLHANSDTAREQFNNLLDAAKSPADLIAALDHINSLAQDYVRIGAGNPQPPKGNGPEIGTTRVINGQDAYWDGHGWLAGKPPEKK